MIFIMIIIFDLSNLHVIYVALEYSKDVALKISPSFFSFSLLNLSFYYILYFYHFHRPYFVSH